MACSGASQRMVSCPFPRWGKAGMGAGVTKRLRPVFTYLCIPFQNEHCCQLPWLGDVGKRFCSTHKVKQR
jgi:hypothetical protein